jgi:hypothetical protein
MASFPEDDTGSLEHARASLYKNVAPVRARLPFHAPEDHTVPHVWGEKKLPSAARRGGRQVRIAGIFFGFSVLFFLVALGVASYFFYFGSNSVSTDKITIAIQGPTTITGGDTVPLLLTITNKNPVTIQNATIEVDFPDGTRNATNVLTPYPRYTENLGTLASGATVTRSIQAIVFGGAGQAVSLPISFSYGIASSNATFEKNSSYALAITSSPLSIAVNTLTETVSGAPLTFTVDIRSNATVPLNNVVLTTTLPFGFSVTSSSLPLTNATFSIGTLAPGATKQVTLTGTLTGQDNDQSVFHFSVGMAHSAQDQSLAVTYMTQDATVAIAAPFITTALALNGDTSNNSVITPGSLQNVTLSYTNTLSTTVTDASVSVLVAGSAIDYSSIKTSNGFYDSTTHTIVFSKDTDPSLASLAPGASGIGTFTFSTVSTGTPSPTVTLSTTVSGTRVGQTNVPEQVTTSITKTAKVATTVLLSTVASHTGDSGAVPPTANQATNYSILWKVQDKGSPVAGATVTAILPSYVAYAGSTAGTGTFSYDSVTHTLTWNAGDIAQGGTATGSFQVTLTPSTSQKGGVVPLTDGTSFSGYDRFAGVSIGAAADPVTTETKGDAGYVPTDGIVQ